MSFQNQNKWTNDTSESTLAPKYWGFWFLKTVLRILHKKHSAVQQLIKCRENLNFIYFSDSHISLL